MTKILTTSVSSTPSTAASKGVVNLSANQTYTVLNSDTSVTGSSGVESVNLPDSANAVSLLGSIENINLSNGIFNYYLASDGLLGAFVFNSAGHLMAIVGSSTSGVHVNFSDKSSLTLSVNANGYEQIHYDKVQFIANINVTLPNGNIMLMGQSNDVVNVPAGVYGVTADANFAQFNLSIPYASSTLSSSSSVLNVFDASNNKVLSWSANNTGKETLEFTNAIGVLGLSSSGVAQFTLEDYLIGAGQTFTLNQSGVAVFGNIGNETLVLNASDRSEMVDANVEKVVFPGKMSSYTWKTTAGVINVLDASNTSVANVTVDHSSSGTVLQFADQTVNVENTAQGTVVLNAQGQVLASSTASPTASSSASSTNASSASSSAHFSYTLDWTKFSSYSQDVAAVQSCLNAALNKIGSYLNAKGALDIQVIAENTGSNVLAEASPAMVTTPAAIQSTSHGANITTEFLAESQTGTDANGSAADAFVYVNMADYSLFNLNPNQAPSSNQYDLTSILLHEIFHALGFSGDIGASASNKTPFDTYVSTINGNPYFVGAHAEAVYGGPVPLAPASAGSGSAYYHVNIASDLMNDSIVAGQVKNVSALDVAMLQDLGAPVLVGVSA